jgi:hypothetical protein
LQHHLSFMQGTVVMEVTVEAPPRAVEGKAEMAAIALQVKVVTAARVAIAPQAEEVMEAMEVVDRKAEARAGKAVMALQGMGIVEAMVQEDNQP